MADLEAPAPGSTVNPPVNAATLVYVLFAVAVVGLHFLARFQCVARMEPDR